MLFLYSKSEAADMYRTFLENEIFFELINELLPENGVP